MKNNMLVLLVLFATLTGCDDTTQYVEKYSPAVVPEIIFFPPDYTINDNGNIITISGQEKCPTGYSVMISLLDAPSYEGRDECIVITPTTSEVNVNVTINGTLIKELWLVEHNSQNINSVDFQRPDGSLVVGYRNDNED